MVSFLNRLIYMFLSLNSLSMMTFDYDLECLKLGHNGPEETAYIEQGVG